MISKLQSLLLLINVVHALGNDQIPRVQEDDLTLTPKLRHLRKIHSAFFECGSKAYCVKRTQDCVDESSCQCKNGFTLSHDGRDCVDLDECEANNPCPTDAICVDRDPDDYYYECKCKPGFEGIYEDEGSELLDGVPVALRPTYCSFGGKKSIEIEVGVIIGEETESNLALAAEIGVAMILDEETDLSSATRASIDYLEAFLQGTEFVMSPETNEDIGGRALAEVQTTDTYYMKIIGVTSVATDSGFQLTFDYILSSEIPESDDADDTNAELAALKISATLDITGNILLTVGESVDSGSSDIPQRIGTDREALGSIAGLVSKQLLVNENEDLLEEVQFGLSDTDLEDVLTFFVVDEGMDIVPAIPSSFPSLVPSGNPSSSPSLLPSTTPTIAPTTSAPTKAPTTLVPTPVPTTAAPTTLAPTPAPTNAPTVIINFATPTWIESTGGPALDSAISVAGGVTFPSGGCPGTCPSTNLRSCNPSASTNSQNTFRFNGYVPGGPDTCCNANSCFAAYIDSEEFNGDSIMFTYSAQGGGDWYEAVIAVYASGTETAVAALHVRGQRINSPITNTLSGFTTGNYFIRFWVGSYDRSGGGMLGASMTVTSFSA